MRHILHILTREDDPLARQMIALQKNQPDHQVAVVDLTEPEPDYRAILQAIFAADSVETW